LVNPVLTPLDQRQEEDWEGCLSIPGLRGLVPRYLRVGVKAQNLEGEVVEFEASGFHARVIQHEYDHLDGVVFLDRMRSLASLSFESEWERFAQKSET
jgi:peptide deformylase